MSNLIGAHVSGGKNLAPAIEQAKALRCEAIQVFLSSPHGFKVGEPDIDLDKRFVKEAEKEKLKLFVHGPYIMNFGSMKSSSRWGAGEVMKKTLARANAINAEGVVLHSGSSNSDPREAGLERLGKALTPILDALEPHDTPILLEPMAGQGNMLSSTVDSIPSFFEAVNWHPMLGVCLDTAHLLAAGEKIDEPGGMTDLLDRFGSIVGFDRLKLIHANDSKAARGSHLDRHQNLGLGTLGSHCWEEIFAHPKVKVPLILETPGNGIPEDLKILKTVRKEFGSN